MSGEQDAMTDVLFRIKRGLSGYVSYLAACEMNESLSEYSLYEPILRILSAAGFHTRSEVPCPGYPRNENGGDHKKLDFVASKPNPALHFALEAKWAKKSRLKICGDVDKLRKFSKHNDDAHGFLLIFGKRSIISRIGTPTGFKEKGDPVYAEFKKTRYGCRIFQLLLA